MVIVLAESLHPKRLAKINAVKQPMITEPSLISGVENRKSGNEKAAIAIERTAGCNLGTFTGLRTTGWRIAWKHLLSPKAKRMGRGER